MITKMHIENFKCFKEFDIELGPFNVLIGPNGSGKSSLLQAIRLGISSVEMSQPFDPTSKNPFGSWGKSGIDVGFGSHVFWGDNKTSRCLFGLEVMDKIHGRLTFSVEGRPETGFLAGYTTESSPAPFDESMAMAVRDALTPQFAFVLDPGELKAPSELNSSPFALSASGKGLASMLNAIFGQDRDAFLKLEDAFCEHFRQYKRILFAPKSFGEKDKVGQVLIFKTNKGRELPAWSVSDGEIRYLAYLALRFIPLTIKVMLIEEPENGVHFQRLQEIIDILRKLQVEKGTHVIMTTHSPFLVDLVESNEVLVFQKDNEGAAHAGRLSDFPDVEDMKKHFMTGEIWTMLDQVKRL